MRAFLIILGITGFLAACEKAPTETLTETLVVPEPVSEKLWSMKNLGSLEI